MINTHFPEMKQLAFDPGFLSAKTQLKTLTAASSESRFMNNGCQDYFKTIHQTVTRLCRCVFDMLTGTIHQNVTRLCRCVFDMLTGTLLQRLSS